VNTVARGEVPGEGVVADYLANRLSEAEAQAFELYCLNHPEFARHVEREVALKAGIRQVQAAGSEGAKVSALPSPKRKYAGWPLALAASVVIVISAVVVYQYSSKSPSGLVAFTSVSDLPEKLRHAAVSQIRLARMRGSDTVLTVLASSDGVVEFRLIPDSTSESGLYSVRIAAESTTSIEPLTVSGLKPTADGFLEVYVPAAPMIGRTWVVSVRNDADTANAQNPETFRVEIAAELGTSH
jgi:hypothetical protein